MRRLWRVRVRLPRNKLDEQHGDVALDHRRRRLASRLYCICRVEQRDDGDIGDRPKLARESDVGERAYWNYEIWIKRLETGVGSMVGGDGAIYAIRRQLYQEPDHLRRRGPSASNRSRPAPRAACVDRFRGGAYHPALWSRIEEPNDAEGSEGWRH